MTCRLTPPHMWYADGELLVALVFQSGSCKLVGSLTPPPRPLLFFLVVNRFFHNTAALDTCDTSHTDRIVLSGK
jgi:hypothetical protein